MTARVGLMLTPIRETDGSSRRKNILANVLLENGYPSIRDFQSRNGLKVDGIFGNMSYTKLYEIILKPTELVFRDFTPVATNKNQIVWHHSAGWDNARGMFEWWSNDGQRNVATAIGITDNGSVFRGYNEIFWAHHIGMRHPNNPVRNVGSVAVEICNMGSLMKNSNGDFVTWINDYGRQGRPTIFADKTKVINLEYKGFSYFERYTDAEIKTLKNWTLLQAIFWDIPVNYREEDMFPPQRNRVWTVSQNAINGVAGIYTHNSFLADKNDVAPQPHLIEMAKELSKYQNA